MLGYYFVVFFRFIFIFRDIFFVFICFGDIDWVNSRFGNVGVEDGILVIEWDGEGGGDM